MIQKPKAREIEQWAKELMPFVTRDCDKQILQTGPHSWIGALHYQSLKTRWKKMKGIDDAPPEPKQYASPK